MPNFSHYGILGFNIALVLAIAGILCYVMLPRSRKMSNEHSILAAAILFALVVGSVGMQRTLDDLAPNLYHRTLAWSNLDTWDGSAWIPDGLLLVLVFGAAITVSGRCRPVR